MCDMLFKLLSTVYVVIIGVVTDNNIWACYNVFNIAYTFDCLIWVDCIRIRPILHIKIPPSMIPNILLNLDSVLKRMKNHNISQFSKKKDIVT